MIITFNQKGCWGNSLIMTNVLDSMTAFNPSDQNSMKATVHSLAQDMLFAYCSYKLFIVCLLMFWCDRLCFSVNVEHKHTWWRHQMETFTALLAICAGNSLVPGEFLAQRPVTRSFHVFFDLRLNKPLSKQSRGWWFATLSHPLWDHCNVSPQHDLCEMQVWCVRFHN